MHGKYFLSLLLISGDPPISITGLPEGLHNFTVVGRRADDSTFPVGQAQFVIGKGKGRALIKILTSILGWN